MDIREIIMLLARENGPSGFENHAAAPAKALLEPVADSVYTDVLGNLVAVRRCGIPGAPTVMLDAHMDEVGLIVTGYESGSLRFSSLGGVDARVLPAAEVRLLTPEGPIRGVIDFLPPHVVPVAEREKPLDMDKLFIDAGYTSDEEAQKHVPLGTAAVYATDCFALGEHQLAGKSLDDRSCAAILIAVMDALKDEKLAVDLVLNLASQEEVGGRGAMVSAYALKPDYAVAVDVTFGKSPASPAHKTMKMNSGAAIGVGPAASRSVSEKLLSLAKNKEIPHQIEVLGGRSGTDADDIMTSREGVATGVVSLPLKYMHTPVEVIDLRDAESIVKLLTAWVLSFGEEE